MISTEAKEPHHMDCMILDLQNFILYFLFVVVPEEYNKNMQIWEWPKVQNCKQLSETGAFNDKNYL